MSGIYKMKRGDTFNVSGTLTVTENGATVTDLTGYTGAAQVRDGNDSLISTLTFTWLDASTASAQIVASDTTDWPVETLYFDVQLTTPAGDVISTDTARIRVSRDITR